MKRTIPDTERQHFDFKTWCQNYMDCVSKLAADQESKQETLLHDAMYGATQIVQLAIWCSSSAQDMSEVAPEQVTLGATLERLGILAHFTDACEALEHNANEFGVYEYDDNGKMPHIPTTSTLEDSLNLAKDMFDGMWERTFENASDKVPDKDSDIYADWEHELSFLEKRFPLPDTRSIPRQRRHEDAKTIYERLCALTPNKKHLPYDEAVKLVNERLG